MKTTTVVATLWLAAASLASLTSACSTSDGAKVVAWMKACDSITSSTQAKCDDRTCHTALHRLIEDETVECFVQLGLGPASAFAIYKPIDAFCHGEGPDPSPPAPTPVPPTTIVEPSFAPPNPTPGPTPDPSPVSTSEPASSPPPGFTTNVPQPSSSAANPNPNDDGSEENTKTGTEPPFTTPVPTGASTAATDNATAGSAASKATDSIAEVGENDVGVTLNPNPPESTPKSAGGSFSTPQWAVAVAVATTAVIVASS